MDPGAVGELLSSLEPDVALLVEIPPRLTLRRLAQEARLRTVVRVGPRRTGAAVLLGEDETSLSTGRLPLASPEGAVRRAVAHAVVRVAGLRLSVLAFQLGLEPELRRRNARRIQDHLADVDAQAVIGADLNEGPGGAVATALSSSLQDAWAVAGEGPGDTYPTPGPSTRRDYVYVEQTLAVARCWVPSEPPVDVASHHRPVVAELAGEHPGTGRSEPEPVEQARPEPDRADEEIDASAA